MGKMGRYLVAISGVISVILMPFLTATAAKKTDFKKDLSKTTKKDFKCIALVTKGKCWAPFEVKFELINLLTSKSILEISLPKDKMYLEQEVPCKDLENSRFMAKYSPPIWQEDINRLYQSREVWLPPYSVEPTVNYWSFQMCFPRDFQSVPLPLQGIRDCGCQFPIPPDPKKKKAS